MAHLIIEVARTAMERGLLTLPIEDQTSGRPDILAPPSVFRRTVVTMYGTLRVQLFIRTVSLGAIAGSSRSVLTLGFDQGSIEALSMGQAVGLLAGQIAIPFGLMSRAVPVQDGQDAQICADFTGTTVVFTLDGPSRNRLATTFGAGPAALFEGAVGSALTAQFRSIGVRPTGLDFNFTPGVPSENLMTVDELPAVVWVDGNTLALSLRYAPNEPPPPFGPVPFLPPGQASAFGMQLSNDGFQRAVRNPVVREVARAMLSARLIDRFINDAYAARGGTGGITDADRAEGQMRLDVHLRTPQGQQEVANETPGPVGGGMLRRRVTNVPDPFSDFDVEIPFLDLWLGQDRIEGRAIARGSVNGFRFTAHISFRARPVFVGAPNVAIELRDIQIDEPDLDITLPWWLEWASALIVGRIAGPVMGVIVGLLLADIVESLAEAFIPSNLGSQVPALPQRRVGTLPRGASLGKLDVTPQRLAVMGNWFIALNDPRPFYPTVRIVDRIEREVVGAPRDGVGWFMCLGMLGVVADSTREGGGAAFNYQFQAWRSRVTVTIEASAVPLPLTYAPWTIAIGYTSMEMYNPPILPDTVQPLVAGPLAVSADVWHPEPPLRGSVTTEPFVIGVQGSSDTQFVLDVPPEAACILVALSTQVVDAAGTTWQLSTHVDVPNATVMFGPDFQSYGEECERNRRELKLVEEASRLERVWYPPDVFARAVRRAIRTDQPAAVAAVESLFERHGTNAFTPLLAPSLMTERT